MSESSGSDDDDDDTGIYVPQGYEDHFYDGPLLGDDLPGDDLEQMNENGVKRQRVEPPPARTFAFQPAASATVSAHATPTVPAAANGTSAAQPAVTSEKIVAHTARYYKQLNMPPDQWPRAPSGDSKRAPRQARPAPSAPT